MCSRGHWRPAEDEKLRELVQQFGPHNWNAIAQKLTGRSGKKKNLKIDRLLQFLKLTKTV